MHLLINDNKAIANKWFAAFNAHDLDALLVLYKDDAEHYCPKLKVHQPKTNGRIGERPGSDVVSGRAA